MIIIPMAGLSSRFFNAGFDKPKYQLIADDKTLFEWSLSSFKKYYSNQHFVFVCRNVFDTPLFIQKIISEIGIKKHSVLVLENETKGQAETVKLAIEKYHNNDDEILVFNIDSIRHDFEYYNAECDGYLEVFKGEGEHWSFVLPEKDTDNVLKTTEKVRISDYCSNGIYYFKNKDVFMKAYINSYAKADGEQYIAPMYNYLINNGYNVKFNLIDSDKNSFMGTPQEYYDFLNTLK